MISLSTARKLLGKEGKTMSDEQIQTLLNNLYTLADVITDYISVKGSGVSSEVLNSQLIKEQNGVEQAK